MIRIRNPQHVPFFPQMEQLRRTGTLCDTLLTVEGRSFKAHALILALASKRLWRQLTNQHSPAPGYSCAIENISPHTFKQILDYVYSESVEVPRGDLEELLRGAEYLEVESLIEQCQAELESPVTSTEQKLILLHNEKLYGDTQSTIKSHPLDEDHLEDQSSSSCSSVSPQPLSSREISISSTPLCPSPRLCWPSVNPSQNMAFNGREFMALHPLRASQHLLAYPYHTSMYPVLYRSLNAQVPSSFMGYPGLLQPYHSLVHSPPLTQDSPFMQGVRGKTSSVNAALTGSVPEEQERKLKVREEQEMCCRYCSKPALENPWRSLTGSSPAGSGELIFRCKFCGRGGRGERSLRSLSKGLGGEKPYQCKECSKRFSLKHQLDTHHRVHTGEKPFECRLCGQRSRDYSAMIKHLRTHGGATPYQCTLCLEFCSSLAAMQKHVKSHPSRDFPPDWSLSSTYLYNSHT